MLVITAGIAVIGLIATFQVSLWTERYFKYEMSFACPTAFLESSLNRLFYWVTPIGLCMVTLVMARSYWVLIVLVYFLSMQLGGMKAKKEYVTGVAKAIMDCEGIPLKEAKRKAKLYIRTRRKVDKILRS